MGLPKNLTFWGALSAFCLIAIILFFASSSKNFLLYQKQGNAFDESQYLKQNIKLAEPDLSIIDGDTLEQNAPPFLVSGKTLAALGETSTNRREITQYFVKRGDTLSSIAKKFNISLETILWANNLSYGSLIQPGQKLIILPVSGVMHIVQKGDTLSGLAKIYQVSEEDIAEFNNVEDGKIFIGDILVIPGAEKPKFAQNYNLVPVANSYFICPIPAPCRITQELHWFNAVDFSNGKCGEPVFSAAAGTVQRIGYTNLGGNYVRILHPNGVITYYGHLAKIAVSSGEKVYRGQVIGYVGHTGYTVPSGPAGCHVHFDVRFAKNPFAKYPLGTELLKK